MAIKTPSPVTLISASQTSGGSVKDTANRLANEGARTESPDQWAVLAKALQSIQSQIDTLTATLRVGIPLPDPIQVLDQNGNLLAQIGSIIQSGQSFTGIWIGALFTGGTGPANGTTLVLPIAGWTMPTGTVSRATFDTATVSTTGLAERVAALLEDLKTAGIIS